VAVFPQAESGRAAGALLKCADLLLSVQHLQQFDFKRILALGFLHRR
jgi:hypothetical protein